MRFVAPWVEGERKRSAAHRKLRMPPSLALFLLAPTVGELLSGSAPPSEFFNPVGFAMLACLYGNGALLARELAVRWKRGYVSLLVLGAAYGVVEEGLMVKSFFDQNWPDLGILGTYGRWAGVNWVWAEMLTVYHSVFSISIPVLLVELAYPLRRNHPWLGRRLLVASAIALTAIVLVGYVFLTPYRPPPGPYLNAVASVVLLVVLARKLPLSLTRYGLKTLPKARYLGATGFLWSLGFFLNFWALPNLIQPPILVMASGGLLTAGFALSLKRYRWEPSHDVHRWALATGILSFLMLLAPLQELDSTRTDDPRGMTYVGLAFLLGSLWLGHRVSSGAKSWGDVEVIAFPGFVGRPLRMGLHAGAREGAAYGQGCALRDQ